MSAHADLLTVAESYRRRAAAIPEEATRLHYDPAPLIREMNEKAALYEACAQDIADLPEDQAEPIARRFRVSMWLRDERDDREPDDHHPYHVIVDPQPVWHHAGRHVWDAAGGPR